MLVKKEECATRSLPGVEMHNYLTSESGTSISVALGVLSGDHPESVSEHTDRCYMFVDGTAVVTVGDNVYRVSKHDVVYVPKGVKHSLTGQATYFIVNNPPFKRGK